MARSRYRSVTYHLAACVELTRAVQLAGGRMDMASLASALSYSGVRNGAFLTRLANARLFGLVAGRSGEVALLERGWRCLSPDPDDAHRARAEACLAVPLFRQVLDYYATSPIPGLDELADVLEKQFGESPTRAPVTARALVDSADQAGLLTATRTVLPQFSDSVTDFTDSHFDRRSSFIPPVGLAGSPFFSRLRGRRHHDGGRGGPTMVHRRSVRPKSTPEPQEGVLWIDEGNPSDSRPKGARHIWMTVGAAACVLLIGVPVGLLVTSGSNPATPHRSSHPNSTVQVSDGVAEHSVVAALSATTDSGSFAFSYDLSNIPGPTTSTPTTTPPCMPPGGISSSCVSVKGSGTIDANPMAMATSADIGQDGTGLQVGVRVDPTTVWEVSSTDNGLTPMSSDGAAQGTSLPEFAGLTEGTLGPRAGAVAMMGMASPTGYLDLVQPAITSASEVGSSTVDGVAVTRYELTIDPSSLATAPGVTSAEAGTITAALGVLNAQGLTAIHDTVSIDASGFIRESDSTVTFTDSGIVTLDAQFSTFGCAGTVLMPGEGGTSSAPAGCTSPDTGVAPGAGTSTTGTPTTASTTTTTLTVPVVTTTTTTVTPPSTGTTAPTTSAPGQ